MTNQVLQRKLAIYSMPLSTTVDGDAASAVWWLWLTISPVGEIMTRVWRRRERSIIFRPPPGAVSEDAADPSIVFILKLVERKQRGRARANPGQLSTMCGLAPDLCLCPRQLTLIGLIKLNEFVTVEADEREAVPWRKWGWWQPRRRWRR